MAFDAFYPNLAKHELTPAQYRQVLAYLHEVVQVPGYEALGAVNSDLATVRKWMLEREAKDEEIRKAEQVKRDAEEAKRREQEEAIRKEREAKAAELAVLDRSRMERDAKRKEREARQAARAAAAAAESAATGTAPAKH